MLNKFAVRRSRHKYQSRRLLNAQRVYLLYLFRHTVQRRYQNRRQVAQPHVPSVSLGQKYEGPPAEPGQRLS